MRRKDFLSHSVGESLQHSMKAPREEGMMSVASNRMHGHWSYYLCNQVADGKKGSSCKQWNTESASEKEKEGIWHWGIYIV